MEVTITQVELRKIFNVFEIISKNPFTTRRTYYNIRTDVRQYRTMRMCV